MASDYPTILQIAPIPLSSTKLQHARLQGMVTSLSELGYDSIVCTYPQSKEINGAENLHTASRNDNIRTHDELERNSFGTHIKLTLLGIKAFQRSAPVAIHTYGFRGLKISAIIKSVFFWKPIPLVCDLSEDDSDKLSALSRFSLTGLLIKMSKVVICPTQSSLETTQDALGLDSTNISLVVNGIDSSQELSQDQLDSIREKLKVSPDKTTIVVNGGLEKNSLELKALQKIIFSAKKNNVPAHFLIIGEPKKYIYAFLKKYEARTMCSLIGNVTPKLLPHYYSAADIALSFDQSNSDESRIILLNFMANALPVICYDTKSQRHYLPENTPLATSVNDINSQLKELLPNNEMKEKLSRENLKRFEEYYSWEVSKEQLYSTYMQAIGE